MRTNRWLSILVFLFFPFCVIAAESDFVQPGTQQSIVSPSTTANLLPSLLPVYVDGKTISAGPFPGSVRVLLPIVNDYMGPNGCYLVCYSHDKNNSVYHAGGDSYVVGQVRVPGVFSDAGRCIPTAYPGQVVSTVSAFKDLCNRTFQEMCAGQCWAGNQSWN